MNFIGTFGTRMRHANFAAKCRPRIAEGRLDTKSTGSPIITFAREAKKIMIDIDPFELSKFKSFGLIFDILIQDDLKNFFKCFDNNFETNKKDLTNKNWLSQISSWEKEFKIIDKSHSEENISFINPYKFFEILSKKITTNTSLFIDTGCSIAWAMQAMKLKGVRFFTL